MSLHLVTLPTDVVLCILDHLDFPDAFVLGLTCRAMSRQVPVASLKRQYESLVRAALTRAKARTAPVSDPFPAPSSLLCACCLYVLPYNYYGRGLGLEHPDDAPVCRDCLDFRRAIAKAAHQQLQEADPTRVRWPHIVWRPHKRAYLGPHGPWFRVRMVDGDVLEAAGQPAAAPLLREDGTWTFAWEESKAEKTRLVVRMTRTPGKGYTYAPAWVEGEGDEAGPTRPAASAPAASPAAPAFQDAIGLMRGLPPTYEEAVGED